MPLRVMHLVTTLGLDGRTGGMEYGVIKLANGLDRGQVVTAVCSSYAPDPAITALLAPDVRCFDCGRRPGNDPWWVLKLWRLLRRERPDILHTHTWGTLVEGLVAARLASVPCVVHGEHGTMWTRSRQLIAQRWAWRRADTVLSVSAILADRLADVVGFPRERIQVIPNGVDLARFAPVHRLTGRRLLGLGEQELSIGTVGRLVPVKDHLSLVDALAGVREAGIEFRAYIAGDGPMRAEVLERADRCGLGGRLTVLGHRHDVEGVLAALDIFVLSSRSEGLSNTIQEAMASGVAVVATRVGGAEELVEDGVNGILVPPEAPRALAEGIQALAKDARRRREMGQRNRARAEREFGLDVMVQRYRDLYLGLFRTPRQG